jgi:hypothetical protein
VVQSVELLLAPESERAVVGVWEALLRDGLPSQARHTAPSNRPHVTLVAVPRLTTEAEAAVAAAVTGRLPVDARWGAVTFFGHGPWVLVRLLEPSEVCEAFRPRSRPRVTCPATPPPHRSGGDLTSPWLAG